MMEHQSNSGPGRSKGEDLAEFRKAARSCTRCHDLGLLHRHPDGRRAVPLFQEEARGTSAILFVFEAPNFSDTYDRDKGRMTCDPDTDPTGRFFLELLMHVGLRPEDVVMTNAVLCLPSEREGKHPVSAQQRNECVSWLRQLIDQLNPRVVVSCGEKALQALRSVREHGLSLKSNHGSVHDWGRRRILPLYHPSALGRKTRPREGQLKDIEALAPYLRR